MQRSKKSPNNISAADRELVANAMHHIRTWRGRPYWLKIRIDQGEKFVGRDIFLPIKTKNARVAIRIRDLVLVALNRGGLVCLRHELMDDGKYQEQRKEA